MKLFTQNTDSLLTVDDYDPFVKLNCFADDGSGDASSEESSTDEGDSEDDGGDDDGDSGESSSSQGKKDQAIPKKRFDQVNNALREFKSLGLTPADIRKAVDGYNSLLSNLRDQESQKTDGDRQAPKITGVKREKLLSDLEDLIPGITKISSIMDRVQGVEQHATVTGEAARRQVLSDAVSRIPELLGDSKFDISDKNFVKQVEVQISNAIRSDPSALNRLLSGDLSIVDEVFGHFNKTFYSKYAGAKKLAPKKDLPTLLREAEGQSSGGKDKKEPVNEREKASAAKREENQAFYDLYHEIANNK